MKVVSNADISTGASNEWRRCASIVVYNAVESDSGGFSQAGVMSESCWFGRA